MKIRVYLFTLCWLAAAPASALDCARPAEIAAPLDGPLRDLERVEDYRVTSQSCRRPGSPSMNAIRAFRVEGEDFLLAVDPDKLTTRLERVACWTCAPETGTNHYLESVAHYAALPGRSTSAGSLDNAGLTRASQGGGAFLTGDLCPSHLPLERGFLQSLEQPGAATPVALSISGIWLERHADDFQWLRREKAEGRLAITFVNHSYTHPYLRSRPEDENFLLLPGFDRESEVLDLERLLIANGEVPSVFFRFPGLISDPEFMEQMRRFHLIALGAESWLANHAVASPGGVLLIHLNGNEPFGLNVYDRLRRGGRLPMPLRPLNEAP